MKIAKFTKNIILCFASLALALCPVVYSYQGSNYDDDFLIWNDDDINHEHNDGGSNNNYSDGYYDGTRELNFDEPSAIDVEKYNFINGYSSSDASSTSFSTSKNSRGHTGSIKRFSDVSIDTVNSGNSMNTSNGPKPKIISRNNDVASDGIQITSDKPASASSTKIANNVDMYKGPSSIIDSESIDESFSAMGEVGNVSGHSHSDLQNHSHLHRHDDGCGHNYQSEGMDANNRQYISNYQPKGMDDNKTELIMAGKDINSALNSIEKMERYRKKRIIQVKDENMRKYGLGARVTVDWSGPVESLIREIADFSGYNFKVLGISPAIPVIATVMHDDVELGDIARDAHLQAKDRADIVIYPKSRTIELRYIELG